MRERIGGEEQKKKRKKKRTREGERKKKKRKRKVGELFPISSTVGTRQTKK